MLHGRKQRNLSELLPNNLQILQEIAWSKLCWSPWQPESGCNYVISANIKYTILTSILVTSQILTQNTQSTPFKLFQSSSTETRTFLCLETLPFFLLHPFLPEYRLASSLFSLLYTLWMKAFIPPLRQSELPFTFDNASKWTPRLKNYSQLLQTLSRSQTKQSIAFFWSLTCLRFFCTAK